MSSFVVPFAIVFVIAVLFFIYSCYRRFRLVALGKFDNRFKAFGKRLWNMIFYAFMQRRVVSRPFGVNHFVLFWCFLILLIANTEFFLNGLFPEYISFSLLADPAYFTLAFIFDIVSILALISVLIAFGRRFLFPPSYIEAKSPDALVILSLVGVLMIAFFGMHASDIALAGENAWYMPVSNALAHSVFAGGSSQGLTVSAGIFWWIHALVLLAFLNYLPYSKHMHILTAIPNCFFKSLTRVNTQPREEFDKGNVYGVERVDQFSWKALFDSYSCTECGRCSDVCPATNSEKHLNPRLVIHDIKINLLENGPKLAGKGGNGDTCLPLIGGEGEGSVDVQAIWDCTTCGACMEVCPVFIEHVPKIVEMRRNLVEMKAKFPEELLTFFENIEQRSNPWGIAPPERTKWASEIDVQPFEAGKTEYLFYVGCAGAFDARNRRVTLAVTKILDAAGVSWGILGKDELCCGDSLRRLGNEYVFDRMVQANKQMFEEKGVKKVITLCPHCYSTLKNDYRQYGVELEVVHHTEFINELIEQGKLPLGKVSLGNVIFHDSCYLGRYNQLYEQPRQALRTVAGDIKEMEHNHANSFCCGAGGGRMWLEESIGKRIFVMRTAEALKEEASAICVCCPYCMTMFEDGLKDRNADESVQVLDLAEIVAMALDKQD